MLNKLILLFASAMIIGPSPTKSELLDHRIYLKDKCSNVSIVEWRGSTPSENKIEKINKDCNLALEKYSEYVLNIHNISLGPQAQFKYEISIIPKDSSPRNLNDCIYRFRGFVCNSNVVARTSNKRIYISSENINDEIILHEFAHALSYTYNLSAYHSSDEEEKMAYGFTKYLKI